MLEYENQMFLDLLHQDGLLVTAKGLSLENIILNVIKVYSDPGNLVIVIGTTGKEEEYYTSTLADEGVKPLPKVITNEYSSSDREIVYLQGGVLFVSSRILVVDLLKERLRIDKVTGFLVCRAHGILESCQEAFAIRLYRQKNKTGFIKAFSSSPQSFRRGFATVQHIMKTLFVKNLYLWPRFQALVCTTLDKHQLSVVELHVKLSPLMQQLQAALLDIIGLCVKELKELNPNVDLDEVCVENVIARCFHKVLQQHLDPLWHQLSAKSRQLVADLRTLGSLLSFLTRYDSVTFLELLSVYRQREYALRCSGWVLLDAAETLFLAAERWARGSGTAAGAEADPEPCPKWEVLTEVLEEINGRSRERPGCPQQVLVLVQDRRTSCQLKQYLLCGAKPYLQRLHRQMQRNQTTAPLKPSATSTPAPKAPATAGGEPDKPDGAESGAEGTEAEQAGGKDEWEGEDGEKDCFVLTQRVTQRGSQTLPASPGAAKGSGEDCAVECSQYLEVKEEPTAPAAETCAPAVGADSPLAAPLPASPTEWQPPLLHIRPYKRNDDPLHLCKTLEELKPQYVVMYDVDMTVVRRLEVFASRKPPRPMEVFFLLYGASTEEQAYLTALRREKEAFEFLINEKASMVVSEDQDGLGDDNPQLARDPSKPSDALAPVNTRKGGRQPAAAAGAPGREQHVIVDMREFRSELPSLLHRRGIEIEPVTLHVGDYILTPEICMERKSVSDLIGSLNSGRLYNQVVAMTRHYSKPMLLIEFDQNKPFVLQGQYFVSRNVSSKDVSAKLQLLTLHFPRLRLVWSPSPYASAELIQELKQGQPEPDAAIAATVGAEQGQGLERESDRFNAGVQDFLLKLPGITTKNLRSVMTHGGSLDRLADMSEEQLTELLGNSRHASDLRSAIHESHPAEAVLAGGSGPTGGRGGTAGSRGRGGRFRGFKKLKK